MKKRFFTVLFLFFVPVMLFAFLDDLVKDAVGGAVDNAVQQGAKTAQNEAVKASDKDLAAVTDQKPTDITPARAVKDLKKRLKKKFGLTDDMFFYDKDLTSTAETGSGDMSWSVKSTMGFIIAIGDDKSSADKDIWLKNLQAMKESGDIYNSTMREITNWTPYAIKPYIIMILAPDDRGQTMTVKVYNKILETLNDEFPDLMELPGSLWLINE